MHPLLKLQEAWRDMRDGHTPIGERVERNADILLFAILGLALILRLGFLFAFHSELTTRIEKGFAYPAMNFVAGHGMGIARDCPTSYRAPLYILFLIPFYAVFGTTRYAWPLGLAQMAIGLSSIWLVYLIGKEWRSKRVGLLGALFMAVYPYNLYHDTQFYITFLFTFLMLLATLGLLRLERVPKTGTAALNGLWIGLAMLATSGPMVFFAPLASVWLWWRWGSFRKALRFSCVMGISALLVMTPWVIRNYAVHRAFVPLTTDGGRVFHKDYNPLAMRMLLNDLWIDATPEPADGIPTPMDGVRKSGCAFMQGRSEPEADRFWYAKARGWMRAHAPELPGLFGMKFLLLWHPWMYPPKGAVGGNGAVILSDSFMNWGYALSYGFLLTLSLLEVALESREERKRTVLFIALALAFTLTYVITTPGTKYRVPFDSIMAVMAASAFWRLSDAWSTKKNVPHE